MTRTHQLEATLRSLGLSGMLDTLDARLAQAHAGDLGHLEFLEALCEDEIARREAAALVRRSAGRPLRADRTLEEFDFGFNPKVPAANIRDLATLRFLEAGESVILHGPVGVGKTMVAQALGHQACRRGHAVAFAKTSRLLADLAGGHADRSWRPACAAGPAPPSSSSTTSPCATFSATQADDLYELVTERAGQTLVITANRAASDWYPLFPNPVVAESILDRVVNSAHHVLMEGRSYRPMRRPSPEPRS